MSVEWWANVLTPTGHLQPGRGPAGAEAYLAVPANAPSVLVDDRSPLLVRRAFGRRAPGMTGRQRLVRRAAGQAVRVPWVRRRLGRRVHATGSGPTLRDALADRLEVDARLWITAGPVRPNRKPVVRVATPDGTVVAFAKVAWDEATDRLVRTEAAALEDLARAPLAGVRVPEVISRFEWAGYTVLVTAPLPIGDDPVPPASDDPDLDALEALVARREPTTVRLGDLDWFRTLRTRLGAHAPLADDLVTVDLGVGRFHGDWSPWNRARTSDGVLVVWDWERTHPRAPLGLDVAHHLIQVHRFVRGRTVPQAAHAARAPVRDALGRLGADEDRADAVIRLELLESLARTLESGITDDLGDRRRALVAALRAGTPVTAGETGP